MESAWKEMVVGGDGGESSESEVLQCTESGGVEEVAMEGSGRRESLCGGDGVKKGEEVLEKDDACVESTEDVVRARSEEVVSVRCVDRCLGGRKIVLAPRMVGFQNGGAHWRAAARRRCRGRKSFMHGPFGVGAGFVVERVAIKRKHEDVKQCGPVVLETEHHEDNASDDSASSSDSDASDSESEQWKRRGISSKRRRGGEDASGKSPWSDESQELSSGGRKEPTLPAQGSDDMQDEEEAAECDDELEEMQELLELQLQAAEKRESGMKQRMEMMMDVLSQHMGHVEKRVCNLEEGAQPQEQVLERINFKLEKVMEGFSALNENLTILSACLSKNLESQ
ncbi:hypothetical protein KC19_7G122200 [Ceratodon purpureus]|uniref:Uncharacterized protein n=1 Tax=Ceratodon purpureus TaxID=3225 RepID=A0A8T0HA56_CERPU|nr:hypothetical protein KC19_7G122200 [Ceratodon purpureus]